MSNRRIVLPRRLDSIKHSVRKLLGYSGGARTLIEDIVIYGVSCFQLGKDEGYQEAEEDHKSYPSETNG